MGFTGFPMRVSRAFPHPIWGLSDKKFGSRQLGPQAGNSRPLIPAIMLQSKKN